MRKQASRQNSAKSKWNQQRFARVGVPTVCMEGQPTCKPFCQLRGWGRCSQPGPSLAVALHGAVRSWGLGHPHGVKPAPSRGLSGMASVCSISLPVATFGTLMQHKASVEKLFCLPHIKINISFYTLGFVCMCFFLFILI